MGEHNIQALNKNRHENEFMSALISDIRVLDYMISHEMIEAGVQRVGVEQELCFVDDKFRPAPIIANVLEKAKNPYFTTELAQFNAEINLDPISLSFDSLAILEHQLIEKTETIKAVAKSLGANIILTGILPTISRSHMTPDIVTSNNRYHEINKKMMELRGGVPYEFRIEGVDQLITSHDSNIFESCNTSFQIHFQVPDPNFQAYYNWAQAIAGPVLAACTNSPLLFGKRLWRETRIALFQQSMDMRRADDEIIEQTPRVSFGNTWLKGSAVELFKEDIARHRVLIGSTSNEDSEAILKAGKIPKLKALNVHNGTIYKWNRPCYGLTDGIPHLRIENRYIPSGPSIIDQVANAAFWIGLMNNVPDEFKEIPTDFDFDDTRANFLKAARMGLGAQFNWRKDNRIPAKELILKNLIPHAVSGLQKASVNQKDIDKYLGIIEERVSSELTGSQWLVSSFNELKKQGTSGEALVAVTAGTISRQSKNIPVHTWTIPKIKEAGNWRSRFGTLNQIMATDLFTVQENDLVELVGCIMSWRHIRHIPVKDNNNCLVGLVTSGMFLKYFGDSNENKKQVIIKDIMNSNPITASPETKTIDAIQLLVDHRIGCLPIISKNKLVGIVTENDFTKMAGHLLKEI